MRSRWRSVLLLACIVFLEFGLGEAAALSAVASPSDRMGRWLQELPGFPVRLGIGQPITIVVVDLDHNGVPDVALTTFEFESETPVSQSRLWVLFGEDSDGYQLREPTLVYEVHFEKSPALMVRAGDLNSDDIEDLVVVDLSKSEIVIFSYEAGAFLKNGFLTVPQPYRLIDVTLTDLDEDGKIDIVVSGQYGVLVFWNLGNSDFAPAPIVDYGDYGDAIRLASGDFNGDGRVDIGVLGLTGTENGVEHWIDVILNAGHREFVKAGHVRMDEPSKGIYFVLASGDVDRDGHSDLVTAYNDWILVLLGSEKGTLIDDRFIYVPDPFVPAIALHDLSGDGCLNIIVLAGLFDRVLISQECYSTVAPRVMSMWGFPFPGPHACAAADFGGVPYLVVAGAEWSKGESRTVLSFFVGYRGDGR